MSMYTLTEMTGRRKNDDRTIVVATFKFNRYNFFIAIVSAILSAPIAALVAMLLGPFGWSMWALVVPVLAMVAGTYLTSRVRDGQQRQFTKMLDKQMVSSGKGRRGVAESSVVYVAGEPLVEAHLSEMVQSFIRDPDFIAARNTEVSGVQTFVPAIGTADSTRPTVKRSFL